MKAPWLCRWLIGRSAPPPLRDESLGDFVEAHQKNVARRGRVLGTAQSYLEALDLAWALRRERRRTSSAHARLVQGSPREPLFSALDFKLGLRMLARYPGLTVLGSLAMIFALTVGATAFEMMSQLVYPRLPLPDGDRIVGLEVWDVEQAGNEDPRLSWDFTQWNERLTGVEDLGAFRTAGVNMRIPSGEVFLALVAEMSASGFEVAGVQPQLGRTYRDDEMAGPPVVVLGHDLWTGRFDSDPEVIGKSVNVGGRARTVIGVMPEGFLFPIVHEAWIPMGVELAAHGPREGPAISVFGKLSEGRTLEQARTELEVVGEALALESPTTHASLRPQLLPYATSIFGLSGAMQSMLVTVGFYGSNLTGILFVVLICGNVALLMFARAVAREGELVVRGALGASRRRIITQLFAEALVLAGVAAVIALGTVRWATGMIYGLVERELALESTQVPFWFHPELSGTTILYTALLAVVAATVAGVLPGLKVTRGLRANLQRLSGTGGFRFGGLWTVVIAAQIAVTVVAPFITVNLIEEARQVGQAELAVAFDNQITTQLHLSGGEMGTLSDLPLGDAAELSEAFRERLLSQPGVEAVTFAGAAPRMYHRWGQIEIDGPTAEPRYPEHGHRVGTTSIDHAFFDALGVSMLQGRDFRTADTHAEITPVIVNESFVAEVLGGRNAVGSRVRLVAAERRDFRDEPGPWMEVIGVAPDLGTKSGFGQLGMYLPLRSGDIDPVHVIVRSPPGSGIAGRLPSIAFDVHPQLRVRETLRLEAVRDSEMDYYRFGIAAIIGVSLLAILLSTGGIYSIMSFTVSQRTREIGVRTALGSRPGAVVMAILRRPLIQVGFGVLGGVMLVGVFAYLIERYKSPAAIAGIGGYIAFMTMVCMTACIVPARRALSVEPSEALRSE